MEGDTTMDRKLVDVGHRVETQADPGPVADITHSTAHSQGIERSAGPDTVGGDALQALKKAAAAVGNGVQDRREEVIAYARREPVAALTAAAGLGFLVGLALAMASRSGSDDERNWRPRFASRRTVFGRRPGSGWRGVLGLE